MPAPRRGGRGVKGWQVLPEGAFGYRARVLVLPLCGNGLYKPLDSGLRRNDGRARMVFKVASLRLRLRRHSSEGWNPGRRAGGVKGWQVLPEGAFDCRACCHSRYAGMDCVNHWIPACAGQLWVTSATCYRLGFTTSAAYAKTYDYIPTTGDIVPTHADISSSGFNASPGAGTRRPR